MARIVEQERAKWAAEPIIHEHSTPITSCHQSAYDRAGSTPYCCFNMTQSASALWITSACMAGGAYLPGLLALQLRTQAASGASIAPAISAGLLVGAALCIVLPEGFVTFLESREALPSNQQLPEWATGVALLLGFLAMALLEAAAHAAGGAHRHASDSGHDYGEVDGGDMLPLSATSRGTAASASDRVGLLKDLHIADATSNPKQVNAHADNTGDTSAGRTAATAAGSHWPLLFWFWADQDHAEDSQRCCRCYYYPRGHTKQWKLFNGLSASRRALLGFVVHSAADGLAVGAASLSGELSMSLAVGMAIIMHKIPVAWSLASFLKQHSTAAQQADAGHGISEAHAGLVIFSSAAPLAALSTYYVLGVLPWLTGPQAMALCLLASAGSVLHAGVVHVLPAAGKAPLNVMIMVGAATLPACISAALPE